MALMEVEFGTKYYGKVMFDVDDYGVAVTVGSSVENKKKAYDVLRSTMDDPTFISDHHRNEDAVRCCIALHVLGFDPVEWFGNFFDDRSIWARFFTCEIEKFMDHVYRICGVTSPYQNYLYRWGPEGSEDSALAYLIG